jgi:hypothetical protein
MKQEKVTQDTAIEVALEYLRARGLSHKLASPCSVLYRDIVLYRPKENKSTAHKK